ncbi:MAG: hypothetical protein NPIRA02_14600 [Nitrospirales bacterium]|nr:MAG: hypothetical protein NPIRA02_14600 [Nitrospirales bacterium]
MRNLHQIQETLAAHKKELSLKYHVKQMAIFGSYARNEQKRESDVDILVDFNGPVGIEFVDLANYLESLLDIRVDLVSRNGIKQTYYQAIQDDLTYV